MSFVENGTSNKIARPTTHEFGARTEIGTFRRNVMYGPIVHKILLKFTPTNSARLTILPSAVLLARKMVSRQKGVSLLPYHQRARAWLLSSTRQGGLLLDCTFLIISIDSKERRVVCFCLGSYFCDNALWHSGLYATAVLAGGAWFVVAFHGAERAVSTSQRFE